MYRVRATNLAGDSGYSNIASARTPASSSAIAKGIYMLDNGHGPNRLASLSYVNRPWIDGFAWRMGWRDFDQGTTAPLYNFSALASAITNLQAMNKSLSLQIAVQEVPDYVVANAQETYVTTVAAPGSNTYSTVTSVPWDTSSLNYYRNFLSALANYRVDDTFSHTSKPLKDHPTLGPLRVSVIGREYVGRDNFRDLATIPSYSRANYIQATKDCLRAVQDQFPSKPLHVGFFSVKDGIRSPSLSSVLLGALDQEFDGVTRPHLGLFEELLTGVKPNPSGLYAQNLFTGRANGSPILFQALGSWRDHYPGQWTVGDDSPGNGFSHGYTNYGAVYYEMYLADLSYPPFQSVFESWHNFLASLPN
jgi:hypothetical protein